MKGKISCPGVVYITELGVTIEFGRCCGHIEPPNIDSTASYPGTVPCGHIEPLMFVSTIGEYAFRGRRCIVHSRCVDRTARSPTHYATKRVWVRGRKQYKNLTVYRSRERFGRVNSISLYKLDIRKGINCFAVLFQIKVVCQ